MKLVKLVIFFGLGIKTHTRDRENQQKDLLIPQSRLLVGLNTHFHLLPSSRARVSQENEKTPFTNNFINTH
jgi:hypothetical protein